MKDKPEVVEKFKTIACDILASISTNSCRSNYVRAARTARRTAAADGKKFA